MGIVQIVNSIFSSNTYILSHTDSCRVWLIDIGDIEPVIARLLPGQQIQGVFLTHTHFDHFLWNKPADLLISGLYRIYFRTRTRRIIFRKTEFFQISQSSLCVFRK